MTLTIYWTVAKFMLDVISTFANEERESTRLAAFVFILAVSFHVLRSLSEGGRCCDPLSAVASYLY